MEVNIKQEQPSSCTVRNGTLRLAKEKRDTLSTNLEDIMMLGRGITCDRMNSEFNGNRLHDLVLQYIYVRKNYSFPTIVGGKLHCKIFNFTYSTGRRFQQHLFDAEQ